MASVNPADISIRPAVDKDEAFLRRVHDAARHWEFAHLLSSGEEDLYRTILAQQYKSQHEGYFGRFGAAHYGIIQWTDRPVGRLYIAYLDHEVRVLDIAIAPEYRDRGIGEIVMRGVCIDAAMRRLPVRLHAHALGRAVAFYESLGFRRTGIEGPHIALEWHHPDPDALLRGQFVPPAAPSQGA